LLASLIAAASGWSVGNAATATLILLQAPSFNWQGWAIASAGVVLAAWAVAGIPLAISGATFPPGPRRAEAVLVAGFGSGSAMCLLFLPGAIASSGGRTLLLVVAGQALATGAVAMLVYCLLVGFLRPSRPGSISPRD